MAHILQMILAISLMIALAACPVIDTVKHGPAAYVTEMDHSAHHATKPPHHNINDHDHTVVVILPSIFAQPIQFSGNFYMPSPVQLSDIRPQLPRRPPHT